MPMTAMTFDTLAYVKTLRDAGIEEKQAEAQASALAAVLKSSAGDLATKQDIDRLEARVNLFEERSDGRFKLLQWMMAFNLGIGVAVLWVLIRTATH
jgi:Na+-translocating ferredoxin:NAD+ oxidoreductase RnfG subunit